MRSGNYSLQITYGIRTTERGSKHPTAPQRQWYVTARAGTKVVMRVAGDLATALERTLEELRKEPIDGMSQERLSDIAKVDNVYSPRRPEVIPCLAGLLYGLSWLL
jgi:hypothetical protein